MWLHDCDSYLAHSTSEVTCIVPSASDREKLKIYANDASELNVYYSSQEGRRKSFSIQNYDMSSNIIINRMNIKKFFVSPFMGISWEFHLLSSFNRATRLDSKTLSLWRLSHKFVLTFSSGMFSFIAVVSCRRCRSRQVSYVRRLGKACRRYRSSCFGDGRTRTAHPSTASAYRSR